jgi:hypothetical protein
VARAFGIALLVAMVAAGCGVRTTKPFTAKGSVGCLRSRGFTGVTTNPDRVGFIAGFAANGGIKARSPMGNVLTIAFTADVGSTASTEAAFRSHAPKRLRPHIADIMQTSRNVVLVWTTTPDPGEFSAAAGCLQP